MTRDGYDEPRGVLIGGWDVPWQLYYEDRAQTQKQYAETEDEAIAAGNAEMERLKRENKPIGLYPNDNAWTVRLWS